MFGATLKRIVELEKERCERHEYTAHKEDCLNAVRKRAVQRLVG
jgi:hypothetical protein